MPDDHQNSKRMELTGVVIVSREDEISPIGSCEEEVYGSNDRNDV